MKRTLKDMVRDMFYSRHEIAHDLSWARDHRRQIRDLIERIREGTKSQ